MAETEQWQTTHIKNKNESRPGDWYVNHIYVHGHDRLDAFDDQVRQEFDLIISGADDDPEDCHLHGSARWQWMTAKKKAIGGYGFWLRFYDLDKKPRGSCYPVTVIKVHRKRRKRQSVT